MLQTSDKRNYSLAKITSSTKVIASAYKRSSFAVNRIATTAKWIISVVKRIAATVKIKDLEENVKNE